MTASYMQAHPKQKKKQKNLQSSSGPQFHSDGHDMDSSFKTGSEVKIENCKVIQT